MKDTTATFHRIHAAGMAARCLALCLFAVLFVSTAQADTREDLIAAADAGDLNAVNSALSNGVPVDSVWGINGVTPLIAASQRGHAEVVQRLVDAKAALNSRTKDGLTALMQASQAGHVPVVKILVNAGADINVQRSDGATALIGAAQNGRREIVEELLAGHPNVDAATSAGVTALLAASLYGHSEIVRALIKSNANVNATDSRFGATPLIMASQKGHIAVVQALLAAHANVNVKMGNGQSALDMATGQGHSQIVGLLRKAGAK